MGGPYSSEQEAMQANGGVLPPDTVLMKGRSIGAPPGRRGQQASSVLADQPLVGGQRQRPARRRASRDENGRPDVNFTLTGEGGRRFAAFTGSHVGDKLAVVLDNKVMEVATIQEQIHDQGRITGGSPIRRRRTWR